MCALVTGVQTCALPICNYDYWRVDGMINAPLGDKAAVRLDGVWQRRDGFIDNATDGEPDINDRDRWLVKGQLLLEPAENITLRLIADYSKREENCCGGVLLNPVRSLDRKSTRLNSSH